MIDDISPYNGAGHAYTHVTAHGVLPLVQRRLNGASTVGRLLAWASEEARHFCGFSRAVVLGVEDGCLIASCLDAVEDPASDALRRRVCAAPIPIIIGSEEAELLRGAAGRRADLPANACAVRDQLGLQEFAMAAVTPESRPVALLVLDRPALPVSDADRAAIDLFAHLLGMAIERLVLHRRMHELSSELRHFTASAEALMQEALEAPVGLQADFGHGPVFPTAAEVTEATDDLRVLLSGRELDIAALMAEGRSNRQIGDQLHLAPDTVKVHVARLVRKLSASNRVEAAARFVTLTHAGRLGAARGQRGGDADASEHR
jgi:DNA-binding CsgD family transcriptional regulator